MKYGNNHKELLFTLTIIAIECIIRSLTWAPCHCNFIIFHSKLNAYNGQAGDAIILIELSVQTSDAEGHYDNASCLILADPKSEHWPLGYKRTRYLFLRSFSENE